MGLGKPVRFLLSFVFVFSAAWGQSFKEKFYDAAVPHFSTGKSGTITGVGKMRLFYRTFQVASSDKAIVIVPGYAENSEKYLELIYDFNKAGYSVYILDHRGMGRSGRELANRQIVHVANFSDYVVDLKTFFDLVVNRGPEKNRFIFSHSTGGLIAAKLLAGNKDLVKAAVFSAPLFELNTGSYGTWIAGSLAATLDWFGRGEKYAPGFSDFNPRTAAITPTTSCSDPGRFAAYNATLIANPLLVMGGPSARWVREVIKATDVAEVRKLGRSMRIPLLLFQAGSDSLVLPGGQRAFCFAAKNCTLLHFKGARHEIWREGDATRNSAIARGLGFFAKQP